MMRVKEFVTSFVMPTDDEIREGVRVAKEEDCIVRISYFVPYSGSYTLDITPNSTFEECYVRVHNHTYPV